MKDIEMKYSNKEITIVWKPSQCIHSTLCWKGESGLLSVFNPTIKPWINPEGASSEEIIQRVKACPSGALSYFENDQPEPDEVVMEEYIVEVVSNGPLMVYGNIKVKDKDGQETSKNKVTAFCRCGASANKPYCDGTHRKINFEG